MWSDRVLYLGPSFDPEVHKHNVVQVCLGIDGPFRISLGEDGPWQWTRAALIGSNTPHKISSHETKMAFLYLESETDDYQAMLQFSAEAKSGILQSKVDENLLQELVIAQENCSEVVAKELANQILSIFGLSLNERELIDPRIAKVLQKLEQTDHGQCESRELEELACLSASRLQHLFREQMGVPIRRYSLWLRLRRVLGQAIKGQTLMEAAHGAGFSDSAHFSRVFKGMFGIAPSLLFSAENSVTFFLSEMKSVRG